MSSGKGFREKLQLDGCQGIFDETGDTEELVKAVTELLLGGNFAPREIIRKLLDHPLGDDPVSTLSPRELQVFQFVGQGLGTGEIAARLDLSMKTVSTFKKRLKLKLGAESSGASNGHAAWKSVNEATP